MINLDDFDIIQFLEENNIDYKLVGKNIGTNWIGVSPCINKNCEDTRYHFGINKNNKSFFCWNCGCSGNLIQFISSIKHISYQKTEEYIKQTVDTKEKDDLEYLIQDILMNKKQNKEKKEKKLILPESIPITKNLININETIKNFLQSRNINRSDCISLSLKIGLSGYEKYKLIIPVRHENKLVGYQTRSLIKKQYFNTGPIHNYLYKIDKIKNKNTIFLVEGVFDYITLNKFIGKYYPDKQYSVTTPFSKTITFNQIKLLMEVKPKKIIFMLDYDAWYMYSKFDAQIHCPTEFIILPKDQDPSSLSELQMLKVFKENNL